MRPGTTGSWTRQSDSAKLTRFVLCLSDTLRPEHDCSRAAAAVGNTWSITPEEVYGSPGSTSRPARSAA